MVSRTPKDTNLVATAFDAASADVQRFGTLEIPSDEANRLSSSVIVERLIAGGVSRLSAERIVAVQRGTAGPSRARSHPQSRR